MAKLTREEFIDRSIAIHGDKYDYSLCEYHNCDTPVIILCREHGTFSQTPYLHMKGRGCRKCGYLKVSKFTSENNKKRIVPIEQIRLRLAEKYPLYNYDKAELFGNTLQDIWCPKHGYFELNYRLHAHTNRQSKCPKCALEIRTGKLRHTLDDFIRKSQDVHGNKYNYSASTYLGDSYKIEIECPEHGVFAQKANNHLNGHGCPKCANRWKMQDLWLDHLGLPRSSTHRQIHLTIGDYKFIADGFDPVQNTVYEFWGDYWHGNPRKYNAAATNHFGKTFGDLYTATLEKRRVILTKFQLIEIWEDEYLLQQPTL
jgi:hypothetical protein